MGVGVPARALSLRLPHQHLVRGRTDTVIEGIESALSGCQTAHPRARIELYCQNSVSVRVRIVDDSFGGLSRSAREDTVWEYLNALDREVQSEISMYATGVIQPSLQAGRSHKAVPVGYLNDLINVRLQELPGETVGKGDGAG